GELLEVAPEEELRKLLSELGEVLELVERRLTPIGVPRAKGRGDDLLEQARLSVGRRAEGAQVPCRDAVAGELRAGQRDLDVALAIELRAVVVARREQAELLELAGKRRRHAGALAELPHIELVLDR